MPPESSESNHPPPLEYAKVDAGRRWREPKSPRPALRNSLACAGMTSAVVVAMLVVPTDPLCVQVVLGWPLACGAAALALSAAWRNANPSLPAGERQRARRIWAAIVLSAVLLLAHTCLFLAWMSRMRESSKAAVTSANLRGIGQTLDIYARDHGVYPSTFDELIAGGYAVPRQFFSFGDPVFTESAAPPYYSSFVYRPGSGSNRQDPALVIAYERLPWTIVDTRLFPKWGRFVLFDDGHVQLLDDDAFVEALREDERRRRELGWPVPAEP